MKQWLLKHDPEIASYCDNKGMEPEGFDWNSYVAQKQLDAAMDHIIKATRIVLTPDIDAIIDHAIEDQEGEYSDGVNEMGRKLDMVIEKRNIHLLLNLALDVERTARNLSQMLKPMIQPVSDPQADKNVAGE